MAATVEPDLGGERHERLSGPGDDPQPDEDALVADADRDRRPAEPAPPGRAAAADPRDARDLEGGEADQLVDDAPADGQRGSVHVVASTRRRIATGVGAPPPRRRPPSDSAMSAGTRVRAVVAATSQA